MNVAAGRHTESTLESRGEVGDDVAEHVIGHDHVERLRLAHHLQAESVDIHVLSADIGILGCDLLEDALPQASGIGHDVRLVGHQDLLAASGAGVVKREADDALHAFAGVDVLLRSNLVGRAEFEVAAHARVDALGVLANHSEIDVGGSSVLQRAKRSVQQFHRADIGVKIHLKAHAQQNFFGVDVRRHARIAEGSDEDGVEVAGQHLEAVGRNSGALDDVAISSPVKMSECQRRARGLEHLDGCGDDFFSDAVSLDDGDTLGRGHKWKR